MNSGGKRGEAGGSGGKRRAGLPVMNVKSLRHTYPCVLIEEDVPLQHAGKLLGHRHFSTTIDTCGQLTTRMATGAADALDDLLTRNTRSGETGRTSTFTAYHHSPFVMPPRGFEPRFQP